jgi:hypothetical protein
MNHAPPTSACSDPSARAKSGSAARLIVPRKDIVGRQCMPILDSRTVALLVSFTWDSDFRMTVEGPNMLRFPQRTPYMSAIGEGGIRKYCCRMPT